MKKVMLFVAAMMIMFNAKAEMSNVAAFNEIKVNVPARVRVIKGGEYGIHLSAEDTLLTSAIRYSVTGGTLSINSVDEAMLESDGREVVITITAPEIPSFKTGRGFEARTKTF